MAEEDVVTIRSPTVDLKRKLDEVAPEVLYQHAGSDNALNGVIFLGDSKAASDSSHAKRPKLEDEAAYGLDNEKTQENGFVQQKDENQESAPLVVEVHDPIDANESETKTYGAKTADFSIIVHMGLALPH